MTNRIFGKGRLVSLPDGEVCEFEMFYKDKKGQPQALVITSTGQVKNCPAQWVSFLVQSDIERIQHWHVMPELFQER